MKWFLTALTVLCLVGCQTKASPEAASGINWEQAGPDAQAQEIIFAHVGITENFPVTDMEAGQLPDLPKDTPIYVHCQSGRRSADAAKILREAGFTQVYDLGGLAAVEAIGGVLGQ